MPRPRIILDCDPGHDDLIAIGVAAAHCDVVGITAVAGNAPLEHTVRNARIACDLFGLDHVPVHAGADRPLVASPADAPHVHGPTGLDGPATRTPSRDPDGRDAIAFLVETVREEEGLWLVPIGPLTNIALALRSAPDLVHRIAGISLMGGSVGFGNRTPVAEYNVWADPEAASVVFEACSAGGARLRMCGLNLTYQVRADQQVITRLRAADASDAARFCGDLLTFYRRSYASMDGVPEAQASCPLHDPCAVLALTYPELFDLRPRHVSVELTGTYTRGMTVVDERAHRSTGGPVEVAYGVDNDTALALILDAVAVPSRSL